MDGTGNLFADFVNALPKSLTAETVRYPDSAYSYRELAEFVQSVTPVFEPFVLLAESFSTPLAIRYAAANSTNLRGLILCAGFAASPARGLWRPLYSLLTSALGGMRLPGFAARLLLVGQSASDDLVAAVQVAIASVSSRTLSARVRAILACDVSTELAQVRVPILYLQATHDRLVNASCCEEIRRIQPRTEVARIDGPHLILQREPQRAAELVVSFVGRL
jgi:pimeloyl-[acyl-carrier protein] methyl ester esterase